MDKYDIAATEYMAAPGRGRISELRRKYGLCYDTLRYRIAQRQADAHNAAIRRRGRLFIVSPA